ncbi:hypothetical protein [Bacillus testis]|uniref:hypothetical protein n=1 Tax=Bacillus testis TaxID=1622072 RepID=UPI00067EA6A4|nr:hypothetical protein [Bacillus testis]
MTTSIVFGALHFFGYQLASFFLERGQTVIGVGWPGLDAEDAEEKEMYLGRNANFDYIPFEKVEFSEIRSADVFIPLIDYPLDRWDEIATALSNCLHPLSNLDDVRFMAFLHANAPELQENLLGLPLQCFYIDSIYGPWMPQDSPLLTDLRKTAITQEAVTDSIFIEDLFSCWDKLYLKHEKNIFLKASDPVGTSETSLCSETDKDIYILPRQTSLADGLTLLDRHFHTLDKMKNLFN